MEKLSLKAKLIGATSIMTFILLVGGAAGWIGVTQTDGAGKKRARLDSLSQEILQREIDHLNWVKKVSEFLGNETITELDVEKDEHKCGLGKWYYSDHRKEAEGEFTEIKDLLEKLEEPHKKMHNSANQLEKILKGGRGHRPEAVAYFQGETNENIKKLQITFGEIRAKLNQRIAQESDTGSVQASRVKGFIVVGTILGMGVIFIGGFFVSRSITRPIERVIIGVTDGTDQVVSASAQVSSASQSLAEGASEQAAGLQETSSSLEEMSSMTKQNADNAHQAKIMVEEGQKTVENVDRHMGQMAEAIAEITKSSEETGKIIKSIDEIAFQTNLLALNAAVEAARAGEAGAGFAVVADEVRNLAMRAAEAAKNTSNLIENTIKSVKSGNELTLATQEAFKKNIEIASRIGRLIDEIASASQEQAQGIGQVNKAVAEMDKVTQQNAANAEESASAAEEMNAQAEQMKGYVKELVVLISGGKNGNGAGLVGALPKSKWGSGEVPLINPGLGNEGQKGPSHSIKKSREMKGSVLRKKVRPDQVIPLEEGKFKEF
jgi:uncharacterized phage infection (PIP) family protein YhgE